MDRKYLSKRNIFVNITGLWQRVGQQVGLPDPCPDGPHETKECKMPKVPEMRHGLLLLRCEEQKCRQRTSGARQRTREICSKSLHHMWPSGTYFNWGLTTFLSDVKRRPEHVPALNEVTTNQTV